MEHDPKIPSQSWLMRCYLPSSREDKLLRSPREVVLAASMWMGLESRCVGMLVARSLRLQPTCHKEHVGSLATRARGFI